MPEQWKRLVIEVERHEKSPNGLVGELAMRGHPKHMR